MQDLTKRLNSYFHKNPKNKYIILTIIIIRGKFHFIEGNKHKNCYDIRNEYSKFFKEIIMNDNYQTIFYKYIEEIVKINSSIYIPDKSYEIKELIDLLECKECHNLYDAFINDNFSVYLICNYPTYIDNLIKKAEFSFYSIDRIRIFNKEYIITFVMKYITSFRLKISGSIITNTDYFDKINDSETIKVLLETDEDRKNYNKFFGEIEELLEFIPFCEFYYDETDYSAYLILTFRLNSTSIHIIIEHQMATTIITCNDTLRMTNICGDLCIYTVPITTKSVDEIISDYRQKRLTFIEKIDIPKDDYEYDNLVDSFRNLESNYLQNGYTIDKQIPFNYSDIIFYDIDYTTYIDLLKNVLLLDIAKIIMDYIGIIPKKLIPLNDGLKNIYFRGHWSKDSK